MNLSLSRLWFDFGPYGAKILSRWQTHPAAVSYVHVTGSRLAQGDSDGLKLNSTRRGKARRDLKECTGY